MARTFDPTARLWADTPITTPYPCTFACWFLTPVDPGYQGLIAIEDFNSATADGLYLGAGGAVAGGSGRVTTYATASNVDFGFESDTTFQLGCWNHAAGIFTSSTVLSAHLNGSTSSVTYSAGPLTPNNLDRIHIGRSQTGAEESSFTGSIALAAIWNEALSLDEIKALATGMPPDYIRPWALWQWDLKSGDAEISKGRSQIALANTNVGAIETDPTQLWVSRSWRRRIFNDFTGAITLVPVTAALILATFAPTVTTSNHQSVTPTTAALTLTTFAPTVTASNHQSVTPTTAALTLSTFAPTVTATNNQLVTPTPAALTLTTFAPTVTASNHQTVTPTTAALTLSTFAPTVTASDHQTVIPTTASLTLSTFAPTVTASDHQTATPTTAALTLNTFAPTVTASNHQTVTPTTAALVLTTYAPTVTTAGPQLVTPTTAALVLTTYAPTVTATSSMTTPESRVWTVSAVSTTWSRAAREKTWARSAVSHTWTAL